MSCTFPVGDVYTRPWGIHQCGSFQRNVFQCWRDYYITLAQRREPGQCLWWFDFGLHVVVWRGGDRFPRSQRVYVEKHFIRCIDKYVCSAQRSSGISCDYKMLADALREFGLSYVCWDQPYNQIYVLGNLRRWEKEITLQRWNRTCGGDAAHFVGWYCVKYFVI